MYVTLHCEDVETHLARNPQDARRFRQSIDKQTIILDYMPAVGESITYFNHLGWVELKVGLRCISTATKDAERVNPANRGNTWYDLYIDKITIMKHYEEE